MGDPIGTVYMLSRTGRDKRGRIYDKGREMAERARRDECEGLPEPYTLIRVESVHRFDPESLSVENVSLVAREMWRQRFMSLVPESSRSRAPGSVRTRD